MNHDTQERMNHSMQYWIYGLTWFNLETLESDIEFYFIELFLKQYIITIRLQNLRNINLFFIYEYI